MTALGALALAGCGSHHSSRIPLGRVGPERIRLEVGPPLAPASTSSPGTPVGGIECNNVEQLAYHIHVHLLVIVDGKSRAIPGGIGVVEPVPQATRYGNFYEASRCYYWLHTHASDGIIHIESPVATTYTLGEFFDIWRQPLTAHAVADASGKVTAFVNGRPWKAGPRGIPLRPHTKIQLDVGTPVVPFQPMSFDHSGL